MNKITVPPKAYSYLRFSTPEQAKGDSFRRQTSMAQQWCLKNRHVLDESTSFKDLGVSAFRGNNLKVGRLGDFLEAVRAGAIPSNSTLLVEALDRVTRLEPLDALDVLRSITREGITVVTLNDGRSYTEESLRTNFVDLMVSLMMFLRANDESANKARRLKAAWEGKRLTAKEKPLTSILPAWLSLSKDTGKIEIIPERVAVVQEVFKWTLEGAGMETIALRLNQSEVKPWGRSTHWHRSYIKKIQESTAVLGIYTPHTSTYVDGLKVRTALKPVHGYYPQIIPEETFRASQALKSGGTPNRQRAKTPELQNIFGGLASCPLCGSTMTRVFKGSPKKAGKPKLVCTKAKTGLGCTYHGVVLEHLETALQLHHAQLIAEIPSMSEDLDEQWETLQISLEVTEEAIESTLEALQIKPLKSLIKKLEALENDRDRLRIESVGLAGLITQASNKVMVKRSEDVLKRFAETPINRPQINAGMRLLFERITVDWTRGVMTFHWRHGGVSEVIYEWRE